MTTKKLGLLILWATFISLSPGLAAASLPASAAPLLKDLMRREWDLHPGRRLPALTSHEVKIRDGRETHTYAFSDSKLGSFRLVIAGPRHFMVTERARPILFITAGFFSGAKPIALLKDANDLVVAAFEYSPAPEAAFLNPRELSRMLHQVPGRLYLSLKWMESQSWFSSKHLHVMGISLGSLYLPSALSLLQEDGLKARSLIFAFGGGEAHDPFYRVLRTSFGEVESKMIQHALSPLMSVFEPRLYLSSLEGKKLVIHAENDSVFRAKARTALDESLRGPKMTCLVKGGHIDLEKEAEIRLTLGLLEAWIAAKDSWPLIRQEDTLCRTED